ncbi:phBC6A51 family helix-turn-helix protein [Limosilactobacillus reuteri]|uniref:phBC6A51 family helix-turn-helix protein n=1 Tax=Limosilactobacillus reuteri TaxID=1598 RepID=UPI00128D841C|nr:phBC6A51 family helix-turn-helix protein [Limosilactobacillus reuteri]MQC00519.1 helix-turn-helix domain-containing protein [Limosilactobacillus reuteri]
MKNKIPNNSGLQGFYGLRKDQQDAIRLMFPHDLTDEKIGKKIGRTTRTLRKWKNDPEFIKAQRQYNYIAAKDYVPEAITTLHDVMQESKSDMARITAANSILKLSGMLSDNSTPELDKAKIRKANADARVAEARAKALEDAGAAGITKIVFSDDLKPDKEDDSKQKGSEDDGADTKSK